MKAHIPRAWAKAGIARALAWPVACGVEPEVESSNPTKKWPRPASIGDTAGATMFKRASTRSSSVVPELASVVAWLTTDATSPRAIRPAGRRHFIGQRDGLAVSG